MNDIFKILLYVPIEEENLLEQDISWIENFRKAFQVGLKQFLHAKAEIENTLFSEIELIDKLQKNSIIVQLILNERIDLSKCLQNTLYHNKVAKNQLFQLVCYPAKGEVIKSDGFKTLSFYDEVLTRPIKFDESLDKIKDEVWLKLLDLSLEIKRIVIELEKTDTSDDNSKSFFLAYTTPDQNNNKLVIEREIRQLGYTIYDPSNLINNPEELKNYVSEKLAKSVLSLHIIGNSDLPLVPGEDISVIEYQNKAFVDLVNKNKTSNIFRLVWIPPDIKPKNEKQKLYIDSFMQYVEAMSNTEIIQTPVEVLKSIIQRKLNENTADKVEVKKNVTGKNKSVYLIYNDSEIENAKKIQSELENKKIDVLLNQRTKNNIENIRAHHKNLVKCDAVIILYTVDNRFWLNSKISDILKSPGIGRKKKYAAKALFTNKKTKTVTTSLRDLFVLDTTVSLTESLQPIIEILEKYDTSR